MNATCKQCDTVFRIDPAKVPARRVRVRCSICRGVFEIEGRETSPGEPAAAGEREPVARADAEAATAPAEEPRAGTSVTPGTAALPEDVASETRAPREPPAAAAPEPAKPAPARPGASRPTPSFGARDPEARARRLARALVSDIATYYPDRRDRALAEGTLKDDFREEIKKSWQEYADQVGMQTARGTPHFRDALNDILAKGNRIF